MNRPESVNYLMKNPTEELKCTKKIDGGNTNSNDRVKILNGKIVWGDGTSFHVYVENDKSEFEVVKSEKEQYIEELTYCINITKCTYCKNQSSFACGMHQAHRKKLLRILQEE